jgi:hypothetical protein
MGDGALTREDAEHLRMLSIFYYVAAVAEAFLATLPILHLLIGAWMVFGFAGRGGERVPIALMGGVFMVLAAVLMVLGWIAAVFLALAGRNLAQRTRHTFCFVTAIVTACLCIPLGTVLGVLTIIVLVRPSVKRAFGVAV